MAARLISSTRALRPLFASSQRNSRILAGVAASSVLASGYALCKDSLEPPNTTVEGSASNYIAIFLDQESRQKLKAYFGSKYQHECSDHLTLVFNPDEARLKKFEKLMGSPVALRAVAYGEDEHCQTTLVEFLEGDTKSANKYAHVTISAADFTGPYSAVYSNVLLERLDESQVMQKGTHAWEGQLPPHRSSSFPKMAADGSGEEEYPATRASFINLRKEAGQVERMHGAAVKASAALAEELAEKQRMRAAMEAMVEEEEAAKKKAAEAAVETEGEQGTAAEGSAEGSDGSQPSTTSKAAKEGGEKGSLPPPIPAPPLETDGLLLQGVVCTKRDFDGIKRECDPGRGECSFCAYMKAGPCGQIFEQWEDCISQSNRDGTDFLQECGAPTMRMQECLPQHPEYYSAFTDGGGDDDDDAGSDEGTAAAVE